MIGTKMKIPFFRDETKELVKKQSSKIDKLSEQITAVDSQNRRLRGEVKGLQTGLMKLSEDESISRTGKLLSYERLRDIYHQSSAVRPAVDNIVRTVSTLDWNIVKKNKDVDDAHVTEATELLNNPNVNQENFQQLMSKMLNDLLVCDTGKIEKVRNLKGHLVELWARDVATIKPKADIHGVILGYVQEGDYMAENDVNFRSQDIVDIILHPVTHNLYGLPIIESIIDEVAALMQSIKHICDSFTEDEIPPGVLDLGPVSVDAYERAKAQFKQYKGNLFKIRVVYGTDGKAQWIPFHQPNRDMQLEELMLVIERIIWRNFGLMPVEMGSTQDVPKATAKEQRFLGKSRLIIPIAKLIAYYINTEILPELYNDVYFKWELEEIEEDETQAKTSKIYFHSGVKTLNEVRKKRGLSEVPGGDQHLLIVGNKVIKLGKILASEKDVIGVDEEGIDSEEVDESGESEKVLQLLEGDSAEEFEEVAELTQKEIDDLKGKVVLPVEKVLNVKKNYNNKLSGYWDRMTDNVIKFFTKFEGAKTQGIKEINKQTDICLTNWLKLAEKYFYHTARVAQKAASEITGETYLTNQEIRKIIKERLKWNEEFLRKKLFKNLNKRLTDDLDLLYKENVDIKKTKEAVTKSVKGLDYRVNLYSAAIWSVANAVFGEEIGKAIDTEIEARERLGLKPVKKQVTASEWDVSVCFWRTTSGKSCPDCADFEAGNPYKTRHDLPAWPGDGTSRCNGYCYCVVEFDPEVKFISNSIYPRMQFLEGGEKVFPEALLIESFREMPKEVQKAVNSVKIYGKKETAKTPWGKANITGTCDIGKNVKLYKDADALTLYHEFGHAYAITNPTTANSFKSLVSKEKFTALDLPEGYLKSDFEDFSHSFSLWLEGNKKFIKNHPKRVKFFEELF